MKDKLLLLRNQLKMGHRISFAEAMLLQRAIDILVSKAGNLPVNDVTAGKLFTKGDVVTAESLTTINAAPDLASLPKNDKSLTGNSPAQSDCCPAQNVVAPAQNQGWIPVSERMPEMGEHQCYVLAADFKNHYWPNTPNTQVGVYGDWFGDGNPTWDDGDGEDLHLKEVTHWMPLPAAP
ncbi:DUF551 domain-containing protein [Klebsiella pneumoniae]|uniref:DUF551 domain-containing protein n=1 Tax=Klebsiella pneumoniae TaxID=573 RepID=UPI003EDF5467